MFTTLGNPTTEFIVGEVSKNWTPENYMDGAQASECLCGLFETLIETNRARGYRLHSFQLHRLMTGADVMNETILAVFQRSQSS